MDAESRDYRTRDQGMQTSCRYQILPYAHSPATPCSYLVGITVFVPSEISLQHCVFFRSVNGAPNRPFHMIRNCAWRSRTPESISPTVSVLTPAIALQVSSSSVGCIRPTGAVLTLLLSESFSPMQDINLVFGDMFSRLKLAGSCVYTRLLCTVWCGQASILDFIV